MPRTKDLRTILLNLLQIQSNKIRLQYQYERGEALKAVEAKEKVSWSKELREEVKLAIELTSALFEVAGETSEVRVDDGKPEKDDEEFSPDEVQQAAALVAKLAKK